MSKTKERILETSLRMFNEQGLSKVTLRAIANEMNISQGNLNYHYRKREDIIEALYYRLIEKIDFRMELNREQEVSLGVLFDTSRLIMNSLYEYRFLLLDFVQIMRESPEIKQHFIEMSQRREIEFMYLFDGLRNSGIFRAEMYPDEYLFLYKRIKLMGDFWISSAEVMHDKLDDSTIAYYSGIISQAVFPYLTEKGRKEFTGYFPEKSA